MNSSSTMKINYCNSDADYVHDYASLIICIVGSVANIISTIVLTRKKMVSPTNIVLTGLVVADLALLLDYIPLTYYQILSDTPSYGWLWFKLCLMNFAQMFRTISIWMTIMLAVWRYLAVVHPLEFQTWCNLKTTYRGVVAGCVLCPLLCLPLFISGNVVPRKPAAETPIYEIRYTNFPEKLRLYIFSVVLKLVPSIVLSILSLRLVYALLTVRKIRPKPTPSLNAGNSDWDTETSSFNRGSSNLDWGKSSSRRLNREEQTNHTTRTLLALLFLFLLAEVPDGIISLLMTIPSTKVYRRCFHKFSNVLILLKMIDAAINFPVFYFMSSQFRTKCRALFICNTFAPPTDPQSKNTTLTSRCLEDLSNCIKLKSTDQPTHNIKPIGSEGVDATTAY